MPGIPQQPPVEPTTPTPSAPTATVPTGPKLNNRYLYPNHRSYLSGGRNGVLIKGTLFSVDLVTISGNNGRQGSSVLGINPNLRKDFQINPSSLAFALNAAPVNTADTGTPGGADTGMGVGQLSSSVSLVFNREQEVQALASGGSKFSPEEDAILRTVGVQRDVYDIYHVLLGNDNQALPADASLGGMTGGMYDLAAAGKQIGMRQVAMSFNDEFVIYANVTAFSFEFLKFSHLLVPTVVNIYLGFDIMNLANRKTIIANTTGNSDATGGVVPTTPQSSTNTVTTQAVPSGIASRTPVSTDAKYTRGGRVFLT